MASVGRAYAGLLDACGMLAGLLIGALALLVSVDVIIRNLGIGNFPWLLEVAEYALFIATFLAAPWVLHQSAHVRVDLLVASVPRPLARALETGTNVIGLGVSLVLLYYGGKATWDAYRLGSLIFKELVIAEWWLLIVIPATTLLLAVEFTRRLVLRVDGPPPGAEELPGGRL